MMNMVWWGLRIAIVLKFAQMAYKIRLHAIEEFGPIIHEFDPWCVHGCGWQSAAAVRDG